MNPPLISILIPCRNAAPHLRECLESACNQDYGNKEIILLDDASTDSSREIAQSYPQVKVYSHATRQGMRATNNVLFELSDGDYVQYLDADDYLLPGKLSAHIEQIKRGIDADILLDSYRVIEGNNTSEIILNFDIVREMLRGIPPQTNCALFKREALIRLKEVSGTIWQDTRFCADCKLFFALVRNRATVYATRNVSSCYRKNWSPEQITSSDPSSYRRCYEGLKKELLKYAQSDLYPEWIECNKKQQSLFRARLTGNEAEIEVWGEVLERSLLSIALVGDISGADIAALAPILENIERVVWVDAPVSSHAFDRAISGQILIQSLAKTELSSRTKFDAVIGSNLDINFWSKKLRQNRNSKVLVLQSLTILLS